MFGKIAGLAFRSVLSAGVVVALWSQVPVGAATKPKTTKPSKAAVSKAVFTPAKLAGTYRWVKSTVSLKTSTGKAPGGEVSFGPNDTITFTVQKVAGLPNANGTFKTSTAAYGASEGTWWLRENGTRLDMYTTTGEGAVSYRRVDQLDSSRLTMSADDALILAAFKENDLGGGSGPQVVGGSAHDELVRVK